MIAAARLERKARSQGTKQKALTKPNPNQSTQLPGPKQPFPQESGRSVEHESDDARLARLVWPIPLADLVDEAVYARAPEDRSEFDSGARRWYRSPV